MVIKYSLLVIICVLLKEDTEAFVGKRSSACVGMGLSCTRHKLQCGQSYAIYVEAAYHGYVPKIDKCPANISSCTTNKKCCSYYYGDCALPYSELEAVAATKCNGRSYCTLDSIKATSGKTCRSFGKWKKYDVTNSYTEIDYYCIKAPNYKVTTVRSPQITIDSNYNPNRTCRYKVTSNRYKFYHTDPFCKQFNIHSTVKVKCNKWYNVRGATSFTVYPNQNIFIVLRGQANYYSWRPSNVVVQSSCFMDTRTVPRTTSKPYYTRPTTTMKPYYTRRTTTRRPYTRLTTTSIPYTKRTTTRRSYTRRTTTRRPYTRRTTAISYYTRRTTTRKPYYTRPITTEKTYYTTPSTTRSTTYPRSTTTEMETTTTEFVIEEVTEPQNVEETFEKNENNNLTRAEQKTAAATSSVFDHTKQITIGSAVGGAIFLIVILAIVIIFVKRRKPPPPPPETTHHGIENPGYDVVFASSSPTYEELGPPRPYDNYALPRPIDVRSRQYEDPPPQYEAIDAVGASAIAKQAEVPYNNVADVDDGIKISIPDDVQLVKNAEKIDEQVSDSDLPTKE